MNGSFTLVKFRDEATRDMVLEAGVVHFDRKPVLLRPWSIELNKLRKVKSVLVWVRLPDLGLQYWGLKTLSALVSTIGKPMMMDKVTKDKSMVKFARVLVDVEISDHIPHCINFINERGQLMEQAIEFEWLPTRCSCCKNLGHVASACKLSQEIHWKPKQKAPNSVKEDHGGSTVLIEPSLETRSKNPHLVEKEVQQNAKGDQLVVSRESKSRTILAQDTSSSSKGQDKSWSTPKRVGGVKKKSAENLTVRANKFSILLENKEVDPKRNLQDLQISNGGSELVEGRILLVWRDDIVQVNVIQEMDQLFHCEVRIKRTVLKAYLSFVYGRNLLEERKELWSHLTFPQASVEPWLVVGDFNAIFNFDDRIGGRAADSRIYSKLDRIFINEKWSDMFPASEARIYWDTISDHCYCIIKTIQFKESGIRPFRFYNCWVNHEEFRNIVLDSWSKPAGGFGLQRVLQKLKRLKLVLSLFNKHQVGDVVQKYIAAKQRYERAQFMLQQSPSSTMLQQEENEATTDFANKSRMYESFLRQKSKINWLRFGDENTAYFHASLK
ncbi:uncharacterized protein LOC133800110 [Humulus lupulus]|uniref:uncharacterized protein LOC133800110 n=1 Tax=Humulus lupulus TaxID=3486 RepID=UPI002B401C67|nr:uncharacterized protein LOC133800110 [Humulus lupulus]